MHGCCGGRWDPGCRSRTTHTRLSNLAIMAIARDKTFHSPYTCGDATAQPSRRGLQFLPSPRVVRVGACRTACNSKPTSTTPPPRHPGSHCCSLSATQQARFSCESLMHRSTSSATKERNPTAATPRFCTAYSAKRQAAVTHQSLRTSAPPPYALSVRSCLIEPFGRQSRSSQRRAFTHAHAEPRAGTCPHSTKGCMAHRRLHCPTRTHARSSFHISRFLAATEL